MLRGHTRFAVERNRPHPHRGLYSDLTDAQLWALPDARANRVEGLDGADPQSVADFLAVGLQALEQHLVVKNAALTRLAREQRPCDMTAHLRFVEEHDRPHPDAGRYSDLNALQLWRLGAALAGGVPGLDPTNAQSVSAFVGADSGLIEGHRSTKRAAQLREVAESRLGS